MAQQTNANTVALDSTMISLHGNQACLDKMVLKYGQESIDALAGKIASAMSSTPTGSVDLTPQEQTITLESRTCVAEEKGGIPWTPIIVIGGILGFAALITQPWSR